MDKRKYKVDDNFLDEIKEEQAYFLGIMASDGCIRKFPKCSEPYRAFSLTQSGEHGLKLIKYVRDLLKSNCKIYHYKKVNSYTIQITSKKLTTRLIELGITPRKTLTLEFPKCISKNLAAAFIRGYVDGDGCIGIYKRGAGEYLSISLVGTKSFIESTIVLLPLINIYKHKIKRCKNLYEISVSSSSSEKFGAWLYQNKLLFNGKKKQTYERYLKDFSPPYRKYEMRKQTAKQLYKNGADINKIAAEVGVAFQTIYKWRNKFGWAR